MDIFTQDDIDFSKDFYKYLEDSYNQKTQENELKKKNNKIIKENIANLEKCIKENLNNDNTQPFDKTFVCEGFKKLKLNNNDFINNDPTDNIKPFYNPMEKLKVCPTVVNPNDVDFYPNYMGKNHCGDYIFKEDIIPKNTFAWLTESANYLVVRMSNIKIENNENKEIETIRYPIYWS
jgi:hypothetical protein